MTVKTNATGRGLGRESGRGGFEWWLWVPAAFLIFVFLIGGGARSDIASLPVLRGGAVLFAIWAIAGMQRAQWRRIRTPLLLMSALTVWMIIQLIPLAPSVWHDLPGRQTIAAIDHLLGQSDLWRPISLTPAASWNSLLAMTVPLAGVLLVGRMEPADIQRVLQALIILAVVSALLGLIQIVAGSGSGAYLYRITNSGSMTGLFANRNHHAVFQACSIIFAASLLRDELARRRPGVPMQIGLVFAILLSTLMTMLIGSRAGFVAGIVAFLAAYVMVLGAWKNKSGVQRTKSSTRTGAHSTTRLNILSYAPILFFVALFSLVMFLSDRTTSISRISDKIAADDLRVLAWPTVQKMIDVYWGVGAGFGSFPSAYKIFEPDALLQPTYFNHAHNDWAELLITGGVPFACILLVAIIWFVRRFLRQGVRNIIGAPRADYRLAIVVTTLVLAGSSLVDYPLRVPSIQIMALFLFLPFACTVATVRYSNRHAAPPPATT